MSLTVSPRYSVVTSVVLPARSSRSSAIVARFASVGMRSSASCALPARPVDPPGGVPCQTVLPRVCRVRGGRLHGRTSHGAFLPRRARRRPRSPGVRATDPVRRIKPRPCPSGRRPGGARSAGAGCLRRSVFDCARLSAREMRAPLGARDACEAPLDARLARASGARSARAPGARVVRSPPGSRDAGGRWPPVRATRPAAVAACGARPPRLGAAGGAGVGRQGPQPLATASRLGMSTRTPGLIVLAIVRPLR